MPNLVVVIRQPRPVTACLRNILNNVSPELWKGRSEIAYFFVMTTDFDFVALYHLGRAGVTEGCYSNPKQVPSIPPGSYFIQWYGDKLLALAGVAELFMDSTDLWLFCPLARAKAPRGPLETATSISSRWDVCQCHGSDIPIHHLKWMDRRNIAGNTVLSSLRRHRLLWYWRQRRSIGGEFVVRAWQ